MTWSGRMSSPSTSTYILADMALSNLDEEAVVEALMPRLGRWLRALGQRSAKPLGLATARPGLAEKLAETGLEEKSPRRITFLKVGYSHSPGDFTEHLVKVSGA